MKRRWLWLVVVPVLTALLVGAAAVLMTAGGEPIVDDAAVPTAAPSGPSLSLAPTPPDPTLADCTVEVPAGGQIQVAIDKHGPGATICLTGSYVLSAPLRPRDGQRLVGPASIEAGPGVHTGIELKGSESSIAVNAEFVSLVDLRVHGFAIRAVECWLGMSIQGGAYHSNGRNGVGCGLEYGDGTIVIDGAEIYANGSEEELGRGSGGIKLARLGRDGFTLRNSAIHDNLGSGVWCDVQCIGTFRIEENEIFHNSRKGVHYEKSGRSDEFIAPGEMCLGGCADATVTDGEALYLNNTIRNNGWEERVCCDGGLVAISSVNVFIAGNTSTGNHSAGVRVRTDGRLTGAKHGWPTVVTVGPNNSLADGIQGCGRDVTCK